MFIYNLVRTQLLVNQIIKNQPLQSHPAGQSQHGTSTYHDAIIKDGRYTVLQPCLKNILLIKFPQCQPDYSPSLNTLLKFIHNEIIYFPAAVFVVAEEDPQGGRHASVQLGTVVSTG